MKIYLLARRMNFFGVQKNNVKIKKGQYQITTSSRKYDEFGWLRVTLFHLKETFKQIRDFR